MSRVECNIEEIELENDHGRMQPSVQATCRACGHQTTSFGTAEPSIKRCLVLMRDECPEDEENFYVDEDE